ncbi:hypothetical protein BDV93DRAFT_9090 [Ceratobasidium sp. AG-I]|nr:hypothetical protein BDV93DRAFT_9090 [Ceratobasidium sp. AG-I]
MLTSHEARGRDDPESTQPLIWSGARTDLTNEKNYGHLVAQRSRLVSRYTKKSIPVLILGALGAASYRVVCSNSGHSGLEPNELGNATNIPLFNASDYLATGNATSTVQENLAPSRKYITTFPSSGWTNQVMEVTNLIYLASLTGRIPIIPSFEPSHFGTLNEAEPLHFGDVFDVPFLMDKLGFPILQ